MALQTLFCKVSFFLGRTFLTCLAPTRTSSKCLFSPLSESWTVSPSLLCSGCPYSLDQTGRRDFLLESFFDREWKESQEAEDLIGMPGRFPVHVINDANHGQVRSPTVPCTYPFSPLCLANLEVFPFFNRRWQVVRSQPLSPAKISRRRSRSKRHDARSSPKYFRLSF